MTAKGSAGDAARGDRRSRGFALFIVLWFLVLLAAIGTYILASARSQSALARNILAASHAEALADAGIARAVFNRSESDPSKRWALDGTPYTVTLAGGTLTLRLHDERDKINPNAAAPELISGLFQALGASPPQATALAAAIVDWTRAAKKPGTPGADEDAFRNAYENAGLDYRAPHRPIESLDELQLVLGMTPQLYAASLPYLTIYTDGTPPDPRTAPPVVQQALAIAASAQAPTSASAGGGGTAGTPVANADTADADPGTGGATANTAGSGAPASPQPQAPAQPGQTADTPVLNIEAVATSSDGGVFARQAIVRVDPGQPNGYAILFWQRQDNPP